MATQLSGLDGHHFSLRSILKNPSTTVDAELARISRATIHLVDGRDESAACSAEVFLRIADVARDTTLYQEFRKFSRPLLRARPRTNA